MAFGQTSDVPAKKKPEPQPDMVKRLQDYSKKQQQDEEEKKKKKKEGVDTAPTPGIFEKLYGFYKGMTGSKEGKQ